MYIMYKLRTGNDEQRKRKGGFILVLTLIFMAVLTVMVGMMMYMMSYQTRAVGLHTQDAKLEELADAGIEKAVRVIINDKAPDSAAGIADLMGNDTSGSISVGNAGRMRYFTDGNATINNNNDEARLKIFASNYTNTNILALYLGVVASRASGGTGATIEVSYTTNGLFPQSGNTILTQVLTTIDNDYYAAITGDHTWSWNTIMGPNFTLRARRVAGNRNVTLGTLFLRGSYDIDTLKEEWATGTYASFPITLGNGAIQSIAITDEQGKAHLNYASQAFLEDLLTNLGISDASSKATNIINYRGASLTNPFDSVEELQQVTGITSSDYNTIKNYVTVYSFVSTNVYRPAGPRAPINVNTAPYEVLKAILDPLPLGSGGAARVANAIISFRNSTPFTCFYSSDPSVTSDFYDFIDGLSYLNNTERNRTLDNCDPSSLVPVSGYAGYNCLTTEFCYASNIFFIEVLAKMSGRNFRVKTIRGKDGSRVFRTYVGDTALSGWRKENFE